MHPNDSPQDKLPKLKIKLDDGTLVELRVGYSNMLYRKDGTTYIPYGILLNPPVVGRKTEIYVLDYNKE